MKKSLIALFILIVGVLCVNFKFANSTFAQSQDITKISYDGSAYFNLQDVENFTLFNNNLLFIKNTILNLYNLQTGNNVVLEYNNVSNLTSVNNYVAFINNGKVVILNNNFNEVFVKYNSQPLNITASLFAISQNENSYVLVTLNSLEIFVYNLDKNLNVTSQKSTTLYDQLNATNIAISDNYIYIAHSDEAAANYLLQINLNNLNSQPNDLPTTFNTTKLVIAKLYDKNLFFAYPKSKTTLNIFEITTPDVNPTLNILKEINTSGILTPSFLKGNLYEITDLQVINNQIIILDKAIKSLQSFEINYSDNQITLHVKDIIVASSSYSLGRFFNPQEITAISDNTLLVSDTKNNRLQIINNNLISQVKEIKNQTNTIALHRPASFKLDSNNNYVIYNRPIGQNHIIISDSLGNLLNFISIYVYNEVSYNLGNLTNIALTYNNQIYALDYSNNNIILSNNYQPFNVIKNSPFNTPLNENSKILTNIFGNLIVLHNNFVYLLNNNGEILSEFEINATNITIDFLNNIYVLQNNGITKLSIKNNQLNFEEKYENQNLNFQNINLISVAKDSGKIYLYDQINEQVITLSNNNFSNGLTNFEHPQNIFNTTPLNNLVSLAKANSNTLIFEYPYYTGKSYEINKDQIVIVINNEVYENFAFILFNNNNTLKHGYVPKNLLTEITIPTNTTQNTLIAVNENVSIFKFPSILNSPINSALKIQTVSKNTQLLPLSNEFISLDGSTYFAVNYNGFIGYVNFADVVYYSQNLTPLKPQNHKTFNISGKTKVYDSENENGNVIAKLNNFTPIYIEKLNVKNKFTKIIFRNLQNQEIEGYILTQNIWSYQKPITAIILIVSGIILLTGALITYKKIKNNKELN